MSNAVQDLVYLGQRLKGLMELSEVLTTREDLDKQIKEMTNQIEKLKSEVEDEREALKNVDAEMDILVKNGNEEYSQTQKDCTAIINNAEQNAQTILDRAKSDAEELLLKANTELSSIQDKIKAKKQELAVIGADTDVHYNKLQELKTELAQLKAKI